MKPEKFYSIRKKLKLTQSEIAEDLGITERTIRHYEAGDREISLSIEKLLRYVAKERGFDIISDEI
ncbi:helix-turn-helix domain-containing protein [Sphingorhabdus sp.]|jgi:transcriptional regulator with XRE-family HTH domain|uniref:helix-turn-helix domain-containing protein n=1 Tax=Sphingorhabdus sp. TaxID=1902408 RepID=UPI003783C185